jgi:hypothetical protein
MSGTGPPDVHVRLLAALLALVAGVLAWVVVILLMVDVLR